MSGPDGMINVPELWKALLDLELGELDEARGAELSALLERSPAARRAYLEYFQQSAIIRMEAAKLHERGLLPFVASVRESRRVFRRSVMAAAAMVAIAAFIAALIAVTRPAPGRFSAMASADTRWSVDGEVQEEGKDTANPREGSTIRVLSGTLRLTTDAGDKLVLQGPATVSFPKLNAPQLTEGWLWIDTAKDGEPFEVTAGRIRVRDIGTRFGVRLPKEGPAEIHLVKGRVEVSQTGSRERTMELAEAGKAYAVPAVGEREELPMAPDPFPALPDLLSRPPNYRTTILSQSPISYWTLDEAEAEKLSNKIPGSPPASCGPTVRGGEPGPGSDDAFHGLPADNRSLYMHGVTEHSALVGLDGLHGVSQREGAVSFWIRREPATMERAEVLWLAGNGEDSFGVPFEAALQSRLETSGQVMFEVKNGDATMSLLSPGKVNDGRWHQVVASWGPKAVDLFVDGIPAGHNAESRTIKEGNLRGRFVRFGKPSQVQRETISSFKGWVDEISLWDRPLSAFEVSCQFGAAVGTAKD